MDGGSERTGRERTAVGNGEGDIQKCFLGQRTCAVLDVNYYVHISSHVGMSVCSARPVRSCRVYFNFFTVLELEMEPLPRALPDFVPIRENEYQKFSYSANVCGRCRFRHTVGCASGRRMHTPTPTPTPRRAV